MKVIVVLSIAFLAMISHGTARAGNLSGNTGGIKRAVVKISVKISGKAWRRFKRDVLGYKPRLQIKRPDMNCAFHFSVNPQLPGKIVLHNAAHMEHGVAGFKEKTYGMPALELSQRLSGASLASLEKAIEGGKAKVHVFPHRKNRSKATVSIRWQDADGSHVIKEVLQLQPNNRFVAGTRGGKLQSYWRSDHSFRIHPHNHVIELTGQSRTHAIMIPKDMVWPQK